MIAVDVATNNDFPINRIKEVRTVMKSNVLWALWFVRCTQGVYQGRLLFENTWCPNNCTLCQAGVEHEPHGL